MEKSKVERVTRSPMNPNRWCLDLACGHELWLTSKAKPKKQEAHCTQCALKR